MRLGGWTESISTALGTGMALWVDDTSLRALARLMGTATFSTVALLEVLQRSGMPTVSGDLFDDLDIGDTHPAGDPCDARNRAGVRRMFRTAGASAGVGTLLTVVASRSSGELRLLWSACAVVTLFYGVWTIVVGSVTTQFALGVEKASRSPGRPGAVQ
jgi:hypothetical protein